MTTKNIRWLFSILLLGQFIPAIAGLDDHRYLPREAPSSYKQFKDSLNLAKKGEAYAQYMVCAGYYAGKIVRKNYKKALSWCILAANQGLKQAQYWLGFFYFDDLVVARDYEKAVHWFQLAAEQGYSDAQYYLGLMYEGGRGIVKSHDKAVYWYQLAAKQKHRLAIKALNRYRVFEERLARANQGDTSVHRDLAYECLVGDIAHPACTQTLPWCTTAANEGSAVYQSYLGELYLYGQVYQHGYKTEIDYDKALYWFQTAFKQDPTYSTPNYYLGYMYENGIAVTKNDAAALYYYQIATQRGHWSAKQAIKRIRRQYGWFFAPQAKPPVQ